LRFELDVLPDAQREELAEFAADLLTGATAQHVFDDLVVLHARQRRAPRCVEHDEGATLGLHDRGGLVHGATLREGQPLRMHELQHERLSRRAVTVCLPQRAHETL
jgi:hypothetical protein